MCLLVTVSTFGYRGLRMSKTRKRNSVESLRMNDIREAILLTHLFLVACLFTYQDKALTKDFQRILCHINSRSGVLAKALQVNTTLSQVIYVYCCKKMNQCLSQNGRN